MYPKDGAYSYMLLFICPLLTFISSGRTTNSTRGVLRIFVASSTNSFIIFTPLTIPDGRTPLTMHDESTPLTMHDEGTPLTMHDGSTPLTMHYGSAPLTMHDGSS